MEILGKAFSSAALLDTHLWVFESACESDYLKALSAVLLDNFLVPGSNKE